MDERCSYSAVEITDLANLRRLLAQDFDCEALQACRETIESPLVQLSASTGPLPLAHVRRIYSIRGKINAKYDFGIRGYEGLLSRLGAIPDQPVVIQSLRDQNREFVLFRDEAFTQLFGILDLPSEDFQ